MNVLSQVKYLLDSKYPGDFKKLEDANVISLQDGVFSVLITTEKKPKETTSTRIEKVLRGWLLVYKK